MSVVDFAVEKIHVWAELLGIEVDLTSYASIFSINSIPTANISCAIGREVTSLQAAAIHSVINDLKINVPITVFANADELANSGVVGSEWPVGDFVLFSGKVVGTGFQKERTGGAMLMLFCRHFLMDLEYAVTNTSETHPINAANFGNQAGMKIQDQTPNFLINTFTKAFFDDFTVANDLWSNGFQPMFMSLVQLPATFQGQAANLEGAIEAFGALQQFEPVVSGFYQFGVPLIFDEGLTVLRTEPSIQAIGDEAALVVGKSFFGQSIWDKLLDLGSRFMFSVIPMAQRALAVPLIPGLRAVWTVIDSSEYEAESIDTGLPRALSTVVVQTGMNSMTGAWGFQQGEAGSLKTIGGLFENDNAPDGMIVFRDGPQWITNAVNPRAWGRFAAAPGQRKGDARDPGAGVAPNLPKPGEVRAQAQTLWDEFARALYLYEALRVRTAKFRGKLRVDIAPGSSIGVIIMEEQFVTEQTGISDQILFGTVTKVETIIDSDAAQAQTMIELGFVHDEIEHTDIALSTDEHPLYETFWVGAPLVEQIAVLDDDEEEELAVDEAEQPAPNAGEGALAGPA